MNLWSRTCFLQSSTHLNKTEDATKEIYQKLLAVELYNHVSKEGKRIKHVEWSPPKRLRHIQMAVGSPPKKNTSKLQKKNNIPLADIFDVQLFCSVLLFVFLDYQGEAIRNQSGHFWDLPCFMWEGRAMDVCILHPGGGFATVDDDAMMGCHGCCLLLLGRCWKGFWESGDPCCPYHKNLFHQRPVVNS